MKKMAKIKENMDNYIEGKLKRFEEIMGYSLSDKQSWNISNYLRVNFLFLILKPLSLQ